MSAARQAAVPAAAQAATPAVTAADSVNQVTSAGVASPVWSGAVDPAVYLNPGDLTKSQTVADGPSPAQEFGATIPAQAPGGGWQDPTWTSGTDAPQAPWDSLAGPPFAPSGAIAQADTHGTDQGAVFAHEHVTPPDIGQLRRVTIHGEAMNLEWGFDPATGERVNSPAGRVNLDQAQVGDCDAYDPWQVDYSERPILNNLAYEAAAYGGGSTYDPSGQLPDISLGNEYAAMTYEAPPDPATSLAQPATAGIGGGWVLG